MATYILTKLSLSLSLFYFTVVVLLTSFKKIKLEEMNLQAIISKFLLIADICYAPIPTEHGLTMRHIESDIDNVLQQKQCGL